jgi:DNA polymerase eta
MSKEDEVFKNDLEHKRDVLAALRIEHNDYHFAQDLARQDRPAMAPKPPSSGTGKPKSSSSSTSTKKRKRDKESEGIAKFFVKKTKA